jgi:hypothetical protein
VGEVIKKNKIIDNMLSDNIVLSADNTMLLVDNIIRTLCYRLITCYFFFVKAVPKIVYANQLCSAFRTLDTIRNDPMQCMHVPLSSRKRCTQYCGAGAASFGRSRSRNAMRLRQWYSTWLGIEK